MFGQPQFSRLKQYFINSGATFFRENIFPVLPAREVAQAVFKKDNGRPSHSVNTLLGLLIIQELHDYTDQQTVDALQSHLDVQHALWIDEPKDEEVSISRRTYWHFKNEVRDLGLQDLIFNSTVMALIDKYNVNTSCTRMDSTHVLSNMKNLTRSGLFYRTISGFLKKLQTASPEAFGAIDEEIISLYIRDESGYDFFGQTPPSQKKRLLEKMARHLLALVRMFESDPAVSAMKSYGLLARLLSEQCDITWTSEEKPVEEAAPKEPKNVSSDSLQNPSDPDAGYSGH